MFKVATLLLLAIVLIALESVIGAKGCDPMCYSCAGLWTDKFHDDDDCNDCRPCNYVIPDKTTDVRSPCPAFNTLANHGVISRNGKCINGTDTVEKFQTYFGCQMETCMLVLTMTATLINLNLTCFDIDALSRNIKQTSWINHNKIKEFIPGKFEQLAAKADKHGKINNWILMEHQTKVIIQSRCKGRWNNSLYKTPVGPRLGYTGDIPFMYNFATSEDFKVKNMGVNNMNAPFSGIPYMHLDIEWLRSIFHRSTDSPTTTFQGIVQPTRMIVLVKPLAAYLILTAVSGRKLRKDTIMLRTPSQSSALSLSILYENSTLLPTRT
jgi:hypothetical protein